MIEQLNRGLNRGKREEAEGTLDEFLQQNPYLLEGGFTERLGQVLREAEEAGARGVKRVERTGGNEEEVEEAEEAAEELVEGTKAAAPGKRPVSEPGSEAEVPHHLRITGELAPPELPGREEIIELMKNDKIVELVESLRIEERYGAVEAKMKERKFEEEAYERGASIWDKLENSVSGFPWILTGKGKRLPMSQMGDVGFSVEEAKPYFADIFIRTVDLLERVELAVERGSFDLSGLLSPEVKLEAENVLTALETEVALVEKEAVQLESVLPKILNGSPSERAAALLIQNHILSLREYASGKKNNIKYLKISIRNGINEYAVLDARIYKEDLESRQWVVAERVDKGRETVKEELASLNVSLASGEAAGAKEAAPPRAERIVSGMLYDGLRKEAGDILTTGQRLMSPREENEGYSIRVVKYLNKRGKRGTAREVYDVARDYVTALQRHRNNCLGVKMGDVFTPELEASLDGSRRDAVESKRKLDDLFVRIGVPEFDPDRDQTEPLPREKPPGEKEAEPTDEKAPAPASAESEPGEVVTKEMKNAFRREAQEAREIMWRAAGTRFGSMYLQRVVDVLYKLGSPGDATKLQELQYGYSAALNKHRGQCSNIEEGSRLTEEKKARLDRNRENLADRLEELNKLLRANDLPPFDPFKNQEDVLPGEERLPAEVPAPEAQPQPQSEPSHELNPGESPDILSRQAESEAMLQNAIVFLENITPEALANLPRAHPAILAMPPLQVFPEKVALNEEALAALDALKNENARFNIEVVRREREVSGRETTLPPADTQKYITESILEMAEGRLRLQGPIRIEKRGDRLRASLDAKGQAAAFGFIPVSYSIHLEVDLFGERGRLQAGNLEVRSDNSEAQKQAGTILGNNLPNFLARLEDKISAGYGQGRPLESLAVEAGELKASFGRSEPSPLAADSPEVRSLMRRVDEFRESLQRQLSGEPRRTERVPHTDAESERRTGLERALALVSGMAARERIGQEELDALAGVAKTIGNNADLLSPEQLDAYSEFAEALADSLANRRER
jgi:hypothetical protein